MDSYSWSYDYQTIYTEQLTPPFYSLHQSSGASTYPTTVACFFICYIFCNFIDLFISYLVITVYSI